MPLVNLIWTTHYSGGRVPQGYCHGTSQGIRPTYRYPCPEDLRQSCRCAQWLSRSGYVYLHHIVQECLSHNVDITHHQSKWKGLQ
jgi:hypothetical protein